MSVFTVSDLLTVSDLRLWQIFWRIFIPYVVYLALTMFYMINVVCIDNTSDAGNYIYIGVPNLICVCKQI